MVVASLTSEVSLTPMATNLTSTSKISLMHKTIDSESHRGMTVPMIDMKETGVKVFSLAPVLLFRGLLRKIVDL